MKGRSAWKREDVVFLDPEDVNDENRRSPRLRSLPLSRPRTRSRPRPRPRLRPQPRLRSRLRPRPRPWGRLRARPQPWTWTRWRWRRKRSPSSRRRRYKRYQWRRHGSGGPLGLAPSAAPVSWLHLRVSRPRFLTPSFTPPALRTLSVFYFLVTGLGQSSFVFRSPSLRSTGRRRERGSAMLRWCLTRLRMTPAAG